MTAASCNIRRLNAINTTSGLHAVLVNSLVTAITVATLLVGCGSADQPPDSGVSPEPGNPASPSTGDGFSAAAQDDSAPLAGTHWQLVELQSMDDAVGTTIPEDPSVYTMTLNADGTANLQLDCNRGNANWSAGPAGSESGSFSFGPLAMTRAACPPGSLDERLAREAEYVRTYLLQDGRLHLSLWADGGIQVWERAERE